MFFHPSPHTDSLVSYAQQTRREKELREIPVVGKERKQRVKVNQVRDLVNERDRHDYFTPSRELFSDYIQHELVDRFSCGDLVQQGRATDIQWLQDTLHVRGAGLQSGFRVTFQTGPASPPRHVAAKAVVLALGAAGSPNVPSFLEPFKNQLNKGAGWCHSSTFSQMPAQLGFGLPQSEKKSASRKLLVIGGGLVRGSQPERCRDLLLCTHSGQLTLRPALKSRS